MEGSSLAQFIEALKGDDGLRQKVVAAERAAAERINRDTDAITQIAAREGYTIDGWPGRPIKMLPPQEFEEASGCCSWTCCYIETSVPIVLEA
jgi:hypothetical protein